MRRDEEETIFRKRLLYDGHGSGEDKRLVNVIKNITKLALSPVDPEVPDDLTKLYNVINKDIVTATHAAERHQKIQEMCIKTLGEIARSATEMQSKAENGKLEIEKLKLELEFVEKLKKVQEFPDCQASGQQLQQLEQRKRKLVDMIDRQRQNMGVLAEACKILQTVIDYEEKVDSTPVGSQTQEDFMALPNIHNQMQ